MPTVCAPGVTLSGLDVSSYQPNVDWQATAATGARFAFIRCADGTQYKDPSFARHWAACKDAGMYRGTYQFFRPAEDPIAQAELLLQLAPPEDGDIAPVLDVETADGVDPATIAARISAWLGRITPELGGKAPIIYTAPGFWSALPAFDMAALLWVAHWGVQCPSVPAPWQTWQFWQNSDHANVAGTIVDSDVFNGSEQDLRAMLLGASSGGPVGLAMLGVALAGLGVVEWERRRAGLRF